MGPRDDRRAEAVVAMAECLMAHGLAASSLKRLAEAAGTSDRMLLYYFRDRQDILAATLAHVAGGIVSLLDTAVPGGARLGFEDLLARLWPALSAPSAQPALALWLELASDAARGREPQASIAGNIADGFLVWTEAHLEDPALAPRFLATLEGMLLLQGLGRAPVAARAVRP
jgi:AcrR family transcriptional regulator